MEIWVWKNRQKAGADSLDRPAGGRATGSAVAIDRCHYTK
jgi:hypothetical protein